SIRDLSKRNLRLRVNIFKNSVPNVMVSSITREWFDKEFLSKRKASDTTKDNDRRACSRFFAWCMAGDRKWVAANPCAKAEDFGTAAPAASKPPPAVLTVGQCRKLLRKAEAFGGGKLLPYTVLCLFCGVRPYGE